MSDDLRERTPDQALGDDPAVRGTRSDIGATGNGVIGPAPGNRRCARRTRDGNKGSPLLGDGFGRWRGPAGVPRPTTRRRGCDRPRERTLARVRAGSGPRGRRC